MDIYPAIDLYEGQVVRLVRGEYGRMTVYSKDPLAVARSFEAAGARCVHMVDLAGARDGGTPNFDSVAAVIRGTDLAVEIGGGVRSEEVIRRYLDVGATRVILGTAAVTDWDFFVSMAGRYGPRLAAGVDCRDGLVAIRGWREMSAESCLAFCEKLQQAGVSRIICTDIARDGALGGTNRQLYRQLAGSLRMEIVASGGVSSLEDIRALRDLGLTAAILGKAYYTGAVDLREALEVAQ